MADELSQSSESMYKKRLSKWGISKNKSDPDRERKPRKTKAKNANEHLSASTTSPASSVGESSYIGSGSATWDPSLAMLDHQCDEPSTFDPGNPGYVPLTVTSTCHYRLPYPEIRANGRRVSQAQRIPCKI